MKRTVILLLLMLSFLSGRAQNSSSTLSSLEGFSIRDTSELEPSFLNIHWVFTDKDQLVGKTRYRYTEYGATVDRSFSWIRIDQDVNQQLAINQTIYEIAKSIARGETESLLFASLNDIQVNQRLNQTYLLARKEYLETGNLSYPTLAGKEFDVSSIKWEPAQKGLGLSFSLGETILLGTTPGLSSPITSVSASFDFLRGHSALIADASYGFGRYSMRYCNLAGLYHDGEIVPYWAASFQYAYQIPFWRRGKISPFVGVGYSSLGLVDNVATDRKSKLQGLSFSEGIAFDLYSRSQTVDFRGSRHELIQNGLRIKLFTSQILTRPQHTVVPTLNLGIGYAFCLQRVRPGQ